MYIQEIIITILKKILNKPLIWRDARIIEASEFFDTDFYLANYPDAVSSGIRPSIHYLSSPSYPPRNPSDRFASEFYLNKYKDVAKAGINPLLHYLKIGKKEGREYRTVYHFWSGRNLKPYSYTQSDLSHAKLVKYALLIEQSGLFDRNYYLEHYPDAKDSSMAPSFHYLSTKAYPPRNPSEKFDATYYIKKNPDIFGYEWPPLIHYLLYGMKESRKKRRVRTDDVLPVPPSKLQWEALIKEIEPGFFTSMEDIKNYVHVIVPVYKGFKETSNCLYSLLKSCIDTSYRCHITVIDDCGPDYELSKLLEDLSYMGLFELIRNEENKGFVYTVNLGMQLRPQDDVILLNSDTEVYGNWIERLKDAAYKSPDIGTVTPLTNNGTICSYPYFCEDFPYTLEVAFSKLDTMAAHANFEKIVEIPTGVGFCLYIKRECLNNLGYFNEKAFGRGYGEEVDFCRRAVTHGWLNVLAGNVFVRHLGSVSFGLENNELRENAESVLLMLHPDYNEVISRFIKDDPIRPLRLSLDLARARQWLPEKNILYINHNQGGGTEQHVNDLEKLCSFENIGTLTMMPSCNERIFNLKIDTLDDLDVLGNFKLTGDPHHFASILSELNVFHAHFHHLFGYRWEIVDYILTSLSLCGIKYDVTMHDYMAACPRINMIDGTGFYCETKDYNELHKCQTCIEDSGHSLPNPFYSVWSWRNLYKKFLDSARCLYVPNKDTKKRLSNFFPEFNIKVRPHPGSSDIKPFKLSLPRQTTSPLRVAILGVVGPHKGLNVLKSCAEAALLHKQNIKFIVIGYIGDSSGNFKKPLNVEVTGQYDVKNIMKIIKDMRCHLAFFPAIWPETYSYTFSQAVMAGLYPVAFDIGAISERIRELNWGHILPFSFVKNPKEINENLLNISLSVPEKPRDLDIYIDGKYESILKDYYHFNNGEIS